MNCAPPGSGIEYQPGDSLAIIHTNYDRSVSDVIGAAGFDADEMVESLPLGQVLKIESLLAPENAASLKEYLWECEVVDLLMDFPVSRLAAGEFCSVLKNFPMALLDCLQSIGTHR